MTASPPVRAGATGSAGWIQRHGLILGGVLIAAVAGAGVLVVASLAGMERSQLKSYRALAANIAETSSNFALDRRAANMFDLLALLAKLPDIQYIAYWEDARRVLETGNGRDLDARLLALPESGPEGVVRDGRFYLTRPLSGAGGEAAATRLQIVFSLQAFQRKKAAILRATAFSGASLCALAAALFGLAALTRRLEEARFRKAEMIEKIAHNANNYLTSLMGKLDNALLISRKALPRAQVESNVEGAMRSAANVEHLIRAFYNHEHAEAGTLELRLQDVPLEPVLRETVESLADAAARKGQSLEWHAGRPGLPVRADAEHLASLLENLVNNAVKYAPDQTRIRVSAEEAPGRVVFRVRDEGPGIPRQDRERVFERYVRLRKDVPGTGLGLAYARQVALLMGGRLEIEDADGPGTVFAATLRPGEGGEA